MAIVQDFYSVITRAGAQSILAANSGPKVDITGFRIGSRSAAQGAVADRLATNVEGFVYEGNASRIAYQILPDNEGAMFQIVLDESVGDFQIGQIGLMAGSTLFSHSVLYKEENKWRSELPGRYGNVITFNFILTITDIQGCINLNILRSLYASLPQVDTENDLPPALSAAYNTYLVRNHTRTGTMAIATKRNNTWNFALNRRHAGSGDAIIPVNANAFDADVKINNSVYFNHATNKFSLAEGDTAAKLPIGVRISDFEVMTKGLLHRNVADDVWPATLSLNTYYSTGHGVNKGKPVPQVYHSSPYGFATSNNTMFVDFTNRLSVSFINNAIINNISVIGAVEIDTTHTHPNATQTMPGFMSTADKTKLDNIVLLKLSSV